MLTLSRGALLSAVALSSLLQSHPDLSGTWIAVPDRSRITADDGRRVDVRVFGGQFIADQSSATLTIAIDNEKGFKWSYRLDGAASVNVQPWRADEPITSQLSWNGDQLIIANSVTRDGNVVRSDRTVRLNNDGTLRVEAPWGHNHEMIATVYRRAGSQN